MPLIVLAFDGLDWQALQARAAAGALPWLAELLTQGLSAPLVHPAPHGPAPHWATVATGAMADRHGICHALMAQPDGLRLAPPTAGDLHCTPFWARVWQSGAVARVAGWPATLGTRLPRQAPAGSCLVADGFQLAEGGPNQPWPLAPDAVVPATLRADVHTARVHPWQSPGAGWESVHRLGMAWAAQPDGWQLLALRFEGPPPEDWEPRLEALLGDCLATGQPLMLLTETAAPSALALPLTVGPDTPTGLPPADTGFQLAGLGGLLIAGPGMEAGARPPVNALDVAPTVLAMLGLPAPLDGVQTTSPMALPEQDEAALDWLHGQGCTPPDLQWLKSRWRDARAEALAGWAATRVAQGQAQDATQALRRATALCPDHQALRVLLARAQLECGETPVALGGSPLLDDLHIALQALAAERWPDARLPLQRLVDSGPRPVAAMAAEWLGLAQLAQGDDSGAQALLCAALRVEAANGSAWAALRKTTDRLGHAPAMAFARSLLPRHPRLI